MARTAIIMAFLLCLVAGSAGAQEAPSPVGMVKSVTGSAHVERQGRRLPATAGFVLMQGDRITTGSDGSLGILLRDETALSLGSSTDTTVEHFVFEPGDNKAGMVLRVARGFFCYLSGKIAKLAPGSVRIETPVATLGVRGTHFVARIDP